MKKKESLFFFIVFILAFFAEFFLLNNISVIFSHFVSKEKISLSFLQTASVNVDGFLEMAISIGCSIFLTFFLVPILLTMIFWKNINQVHPFRTKDKENLFTVICLMLFVPTFFIAAMLTMKAEQFEFFSTALSTAILFFGALKYLTSIYLSEIFNKKEKPQDSVKKSEDDYTRRIATRKQISRRKYH